MEQLASEKIHVRIGGLYALERIGQLQPDYRQLAINVLCAYLRTEFPPAKPVVDEDSNEVDRWAEPEEWHARRAAQEIIGTHISPETSSLFWDGIRVDLAGAHLMDAIFYECKFSNGSSFTDATFHGKAVFAECEFDGTVSFTRATFNGEEAYFGGCYSPTESIVLFGHTRFHGHARFKDVRFDRADFQGSSFSHDADFAGAKTKMLELRDTHFVGMVNLPNSPAVNLTGATVTVNAAASRRWPAGWEEGSNMDNQPLIRRVVRVGTS